MIATSSIQGLLYALALLGYLTVLVAFFAAALYVYFALSESNSHRRDAGHKSAGTQTPRSRPLPLGPGAHLPTATPADARRSKA